MKKKLNIKKFTLIELIIVIVVIGILAGMALPKFIGVERDAKVAAMDQDLDSLEKVVQLYESDNDGTEPFIKDGSGNYTKVLVTRQTLKDTLDAIGDDESSVYTLDMNSLKPYLERLKYTNTTTDTYLYSTKTGVAINEQGKIDSSGITHHILNGISGTSTNTNSSLNKEIKLMKSSPSFFGSFIMSNDALYSAGYNSSGQLGNKTTTNISTFTNVSLISGVKFHQIAAGSDHVIAIGSDDELYTLGWNGCGQLGDGTHNTSKIPLKIELASGIKPTQIAAGYNQSMAIGNDGELYTWGENSYGTLGDGTQIESPRPKKITLASGIKPKQIACGDQYSMAIGDDGNLYIWGSNGHGELGDGTGTKSLLPKKLELAISVKPTQIAAGQDSVLAMGDDNNLYTWGYNYHGEIGNGTTINKPTPTKVSLPVGVKPTQITSGGWHSMVICDDNNLYTWGSDSYGQLGRNGDNTIPQKVILPNGVKPKEIACGNDNSMVIGDDKNLYVWGHNSFGELGNGTNTDTSIPTKIEYTKFS